jgi:hypothetical protein
VSRKTPEVGKLVSRKLEKLNALAVDIGSKAAGFWCLWSQQGLDGKE